MASASDLSVHPERPPLVVSLVNNSVAVDSRVQKVARSLADLGYDSVLIGRSPRSEPDGDWSLLGSAVVLRAAFPLTRLDAQLADPPTGWTGQLLGSPAGSPATGRLTRRLHEYRTGRLERNRQSFQAGSPQTRAHRATRAQVEAGSIPADVAYPAVRDWADGFLPLVMELRPDALHIHDPCLIPTAVTAQRRLRRAGHELHLVYDAHEWTLGTARDNVLQVPALARLESDHMGKMAAIVTVSEPIADRMVDHFALSQRPAVVTNAPVALAVAPGAGDIRTASGVADDAPLLVYTGTIAEARGLDLAFRALTHLPQAHLALLSRMTKRTRVALRQARELGVGDRVHQVDYVPPDEVPAFLRTADVGLIPFQLHGNSELGIPTKFREYLLAGLPIVATDVGLSGAEVQHTGVGEVAPTDDPAAFAAAVRTVLADSERYRARITPELMRVNSWQEQERTLAQVYRKVLGSPARRPQHGDVVIGPLDFAGQATAWARALSLRGVPARSLPAGGANDADTGAKRSAEPLQQRLQAFLSEVLPATAVLLESGHPIAAPEPGTVSADLAGFREARALSAAGHTVALMFHGSDLRRPDVHARTHRWSPFADPDFAAATRDLQQRVRRVHEQLASWPGPVLVSTPDLVPQNPAAVWVPVVVDTERFHPMPRPDRDGPPVVLHVASDPMLTGSRHIDPVLTALAELGTIRYLAVADAPPGQLVELLHEADLVVDQLGMGTVGLAALQAMSCGTAVVTDPGPEAGAVYGTEIPVAPATPDTLADVIVELVGDPDRRRELSDAGPGFVRRFHDGTRSAEAIVAALGLTAPS